MKQIPRLYQQTILGTAVLYNTLVVLPTGMGKTNIALWLAERRVSLYPTSKVLVMAPTKPLVDQHRDTFASQLPDAQSLSTTLTGRTPPEKRTEEFGRATYVFSTPQTIENDLLSDRISLHDVSLLVIDEAHRAVGDYAYVYIVEQYRKQANHERILALTASPGSDKDTIQEIVKNTGIEKIEIRTTEDEDVKPYIQDTEITTLEVELTPQLKSIKKLFDRIINDKLSRMASYGHINSTQMNKTQLLFAQKRMQSMLKSGHPDLSIWRSISLLAEVMKMQHGLELLETQGVTALSKYLHELEKQALRGQSRAVKNLVAEPDFKTALEGVDSLVERNIEHPKLIKLLSLIKLELSRNPGGKIIVFNQYRDMANKIVRELGSQARLFVGQQKKGETGMSQKEQREMLQEFREGLFKILVATAVGEEGLDIPQVDLVVFYEPIPSAIRTIQRRGRTGRHSAGKVYMLVTKDTRDEGYRWSAMHKERRMYRNLRSMAQGIELARPKTQATLDEYQEEEGLTIYADAREKSSGVMKELQNIGVKLVVRSLEVGDYLLSKRVCVEYKTSEDFVNSIIDGRLLGQLKELTQYQRPLLIIQGSNWYEQRNIHPNAIRGMFSAIGVSYGIPVLVTQNDKDTATLLYTIARREKEGGIGSAEFKKASVADEQEVLINVVAMLPGVGPILAPKLLERFGSLKRLTSATIDELQQVEGVGRRKAEELFEIFNRSF